MMLTDKDGEGRLFPFSLLCRLGMNISAPSRKPASHWRVSARPVVASRAPVAPKAPRSVVIAAVLARIRERLHAAGPQLKMEKVLELLGTDPKAKPSREALAAVLGHLRLGVSAAEADELVACTCVGSGINSSSVQLTKLYDALRRSGEPEMQSIMSELRSLASSVCWGRGVAFARAVGSWDGCEWISEVEFRRCLQSIAIDEQSAPVDPEVQDRLLLLAEKNASGDVRWRQFAQAFAGLEDTDSWSECSTSPSESKRVITPKRVNKLEKCEPMSTTQSWRSAKLQQVASKGGLVDKVTGPEPVREEQEDPPARGLCRCLHRLFR